MAPENSDILREFEDDGAEPASGLRRLLATVLDFVLAILLLFVVHWALWRGTAPGLFYYLIAARPLLVIAMHLGLRLITLLLLARTPGMMLTGIALRDADGRIPTVRERLLAGCFVLYRGVDYYRV